jgi:DNA-binding GntR family transcriptional regulator
MSQQDADAHSLSEDGDEAAAPAQVLRLLNFSERREPLVAKVAAWVGTGIFEGRLRPGQDLNSVDLAKRFATSRTPVREALMLLEQEGLVEMRARKRPRVAVFTIDTIRQTYDVRQHLLALAARLVVEKATSIELAELRGIVGELRRLADAGDANGYLWTHVALHERMMEIGGNETLKTILDSLALRTFILRHMSLEWPGRLASSAIEQERIVDAFGRRDADLAAILISRATLGALEAIELHYASRGFEWQAKGRQRRTSLR